MLMERGGSEGEGAMGEDDSEWEEGGGGWGERGRLIRGQSSRFDASTNLTFESSTHKSESLQNTLHGSSWSYKRR